MSTDTPFQPSASAANPSAAPFDRIAQLERELAEAKAHHQRDEALLVQRTDEIRHLEERLKDAATRGAQVALEAYKRDLADIMAERDQLRAEVERLKVDNEALRTLWTEIRVVLIQSRAANCLCSYGAQQADAVEAANAVLNRMPPDITNERDQLRAEVAELRAWKAGKKGIEEYYQTCAERDQLRAALDVAREALREDLISARIIHAENEQRGHIHSIRRDAAFIEERCNQALARIDEVKGQQ